MASTLRKTKEALPEAMPSFTFNKTIMVKKTEAPVVVKTLKVKLMDAVSRVLKTNKSSMTGKMEALLKKSVKRIARRAKKQLKKGKLALAKA